MVQAKYKEWLTKDGLTKLRGWARRGLTDEQIAKLITINVSTLYDWKKKYPEINKALKKGKEVIDDEVEEALIKSMLGFKTTDIQYKMVKIDDDVLKAKRNKFSNEYKMDHPEASKNEIAIATLEGVPTYEEIPLVKSVHEVPPNTSAIMFWLKNRRPELYRDNTFRELNEAQTKQAKIEAKIKEQQLKAILEADNPDNTTIIVDDVEQAMKLEEASHENSTDNEGD